MASMLRAYPPLYSGRLILKEEGSLGLTLIFFLCPAVHQLLLGEDACLGKNGCLQVNGVVSNIRDRQQTQYDNSTLRPKAPQWRIRGFTVTSYDSILCTVSLRDGSLGTAPKDINIPYYSNANFLLFLILRNAALFISKMLKEKKRCNIA